ncbi:hypothetical protein [Salinisphaera orenii]|uniref:hypothetical protein n=1 Tax=Salinisphaera orenii TaxID=856731 RepID=UPI000DBEA7FB
MARRARSHWFVFVVMTIGIVALAAALTAIGIGVAGSALAWRAWMHHAAPYFLIWRLLLYAVLGGVYLQLWRPRLRSMQAEQADGGAAAHARLVRIERLMVAAIAVVELSNLPDLIGWFHG